MKKLLSVLFTAALLAVCVPSAAIASDDVKRAETAADGVNVTRWADLLIVYRDIAATGQNRWGYNVVVGSDGKVTRIIARGDTAGENLAVPQGGMVVSATGIRVSWLSENISVGDYVIYDDATGRVMVSSDGKFDLSFSEALGITAFNAVRYANNVIIYNKPGTTGTNGYGYEICVGRDGIITASGGNDSAVPDGGYVVSAVEYSDKLFLRTYGVVGASCTLSDDRKSVVLTYDRTAMERSAKMKLSTLKDRFTEAKENCLLIDVSAVEAELADIDKYISEHDMTSYSSGRELAAMTEKAGAMLSESTAAEVRGVWYSPLETDLAGVKATVAKLKAAGMNQLCLGMTNGYQSIIPLPESFPFSQKTSLRGFDLLAAYVNECHREGIELVVSVSVFHASGETQHPEWLTRSNTGEGAEESAFYSPLCREYTGYFLEYIAYILNNYNIDGLQLDYIRYPYFDGTTDYGYDSVTAAAFAEATGEDASAVAEIGEKLRSHRLWNDWVNFKSGAITAFVSDISALTRSLRRDVYLSVCLAADSDLEAYCQNGAEWVKSGIIDAVYPMSYASGIMEQQAEYFTSFDGDYYCVEGSGSYLSFSSDEQLLQLCQARSAGADGMCFFELGAYLSHHYGDTLDMGAFSSPAVSPVYHAAEAAEALVGSASARVGDMAVSFGYIGAEAAAAFTEACTELISAVRKGDASDDDFAAPLEAISRYSDTKWYARVSGDLTAAAKYIRHSKDIYKDYTFTVAEESAEPSAEESPSSEQPESVSDGVTEGKSNILPTVAVIAAICAAAAAAAIILVRKKKK